MSDSNPSVTHGRAGSSALADPASPRPEETRRGSLDSDVLAGTTVLLVDDDYRNLFAMRALLQRTEATVKIAESGPDAFHLLQRTPDIDIILMDIMMPVMDGYEVIRKLRTIEPVKSVPIIAVTCKVVAGERQRCLDAGANDYIPKPVNTAELLGAMLPWLPDRLPSSSSAIDGL